MRNLSPKGSRVQMHAAHDAWMQGDRYGTIVGYGRKRLYRDSDGTETRETPYRVKLDKSGRTILVHPDWCFVIEEPKVEPLFDGPPNKRY